MKKMIIYMSKLSVGGMEKSLVNFLKLSNFSKRYDITLYLGYVTEKSMLDELPKNIKIKLICKGKWNIFGKIKSYIKMQTDYLKLVSKQNKYDIAICYTHHHKILSKLTRISSKNTIIFVHTDLEKFLTGKKLEDLKKRLQFDKFKKVVCVSECATESFKKIYPNFSGEVVTVLNYIDGKEIIKKSRESIPEHIDFQKTTFINISRHNDKIKKISRIIKATKKLITEGYEFQVLLVGDGEDNPMYEDMIKKSDLNNSVLLLGKKLNPFSYLKSSNALILSSNYEGYGIVLDEARILNIPFISTDIGDAKLLATEGYGILCDNSIEGIYIGMKQFLDNGFSITKTFDYIEFNNKITNILNQTIEKV